MKKIYHYIKKKKDWYSKVRIRAHLDLIKSRKVACYIIKHENVIKHKFYPFLNFTIKTFKLQKRLEREIQCLDKSEAYKLREINYSCHSDAYIFSYYNSLLIEKYEDFLTNNKLDNIIAYRSIKKKDSKGNIKGKSNIDFAAEAFLEIEKRKECYCLGIDITKFFNNIGHDYLYNNLSKILKVEKLDKDWYQIYKVLTDFHFIKLDKFLKNEHINLTKKELLGKNNIKKICSAKLFRKILKDNRDLIERNPKISSKKGIPQGTNISGTFANIYMLDFDLRLKKHIERIDGYYRRYSDDILVITNTFDQLEKIIKIIQEELSIIGLEISNEKTICCKFQDNKCKSISCSLKEESNKDNLLQYLGFTYDGMNIRVRNNTIGRFWVEALSHTKNIILDNAKRNKRIPIAKIYGLYTHLNNRNKKAEYLGNFYGYIRKAHNTFKDNCNGCYGFGSKVKIKDQMNNSWDILHKYMKKICQKYNISSELIDI